MILRSTIVPAAMFSPSAARWRCGSLSSTGEPCAILGSGMRSSARALRSQGPGAGGGASASTRDCRPLLAVRRLLPEQFVLFHKMVLEQVRSHLGYAASRALSLRATVNQSRRFARSKTVEAHFGLTPRRFQARRTTTGGSRRRGCHDCGRHSIRQRRCSANVLRKVPAHGLRHAGRSLSRSQERDRRPCPTPRRHSAQHVDRRHRIPLAQGGQCSILKKDVEFLPGGTSAPRGENGRGEPGVNLVPLRQDDTQRLFHLILLNPPCGGHSANLGGKEVRASRDGMRSL
jgi:hypothetical protein